MSIELDLSITSQILESNNSSYCKESKYYDQNVVDKYYIKSKKEMTKFCNKYRLKYELLQLLVELEYDLEIHDIIIVNRLTYNYYNHGD